ncbi:hypothetical protein QCA50_012776 [Cerrena zonata]|uniref:Uncharacterized protein n=1 Tax=Cerrena zonata TaxID=2478898 RepID=A0AAW0G3K9_9APHY
MLIPTLYPALHDPEVYSDPDTFIPERWENATGDMYKRNWLVFGTGPHVCLDDLIMEWHKRDPLQDVNPDDKISNVSTSVEATA